MNDEDLSSYLVNVAERIGQILEPLEWNTDRAVALGHILHLYEIRCADGFIMNGDSEESILGYSDAAKILARICDNPRRTWEHWHSTLPSASEVSSRYAAESEFLVMRIRASPYVRELVA